jgi:hypothetical protein
MIPDMDDGETGKSKNKIDIVAIQVTSKVPSLKEINKGVSAISLPKTTDGSDLGFLVSQLNNFDEINETDEPWDFQKIKNEIYETVTPPFLFIYYFSRQVTHLYGVVVDDIEAISETEAKKKL